MYRLCLSHNLITSLGYARLCQDLAQRSKPSDPKIPELPQGSTIRLRMATSPEREPSSAYCLALRGMGPSGTAPSRPASPPGKLAA